jgi:selenide,water dikinase
MESKTDHNFSLLSNCTSGGCGAKIGPGELSSLLDKIQTPKNEHLLVGFDASDDAAVYDLDGDNAIVSTVDFFSPMVDDPFIFGQIATANALSDIYAMGATPFLALNLVCFPEIFLKSVLADILAGGSTKITEAGAVLGGGHSIYDKEIKYGLAVTGSIKKENIIRNNTPQTGHNLILTKPLGVGIIMAADRTTVASPEAVQKAIASMTRLNRYAAEKMKMYNVSACTDITGFGLLCHLLEMCGGSMNNEQGTMNKEKGEGSNEQEEMKNEKGKIKNEQGTMNKEKGAGSGERGAVSVEIWVNELPVFEEAVAYADEFLLTAAGQRNRNHFDGNGQVEKLPFAIQELMFDPQTSGGLLICVDPEQARQLLVDIQKDDPAARIIGEIVPRQEKKIIFKEVIK